MPVDGLRGFNLVAECFRMLALVSPVSQDLPIAEEFPVLAVQRDHDSSGLEARAVRPRQPAVVLGRVICAGDRHLLFGDAAFDVFGREYQGRRLTDGFAARNPEDVLGSGTPPNDPPANVEEQDRVLHRLLDQQSKKCVDRRWLVSCRHPPLVPRVNTGVQPSAIGVLTG